MDGWRDGRTDGRPPDSAYTNLYPPEALTVPFDLQDLERGPYRYTVQVGRCTPVLTVCCVVPANCLSPTDRPHTMDSG